MTVHAYFKYTCLILAFLFVLPLTDLQAQAKGRESDTQKKLLIVDNDTERPIEGAYMVLGNKPFLSSSKGVIALPVSTDLQNTVVIQNLGYRSQHIRLDEAFRKESVYMVRLSPEVERLEEVVVTGEQSRVTLNAVADKLSSPAINRAIGTSLTSLLEQVSGVSSISTGTTVAKPVIEGMYGNRILIVNNGTRQTGQQWGADHAPEVDMNSSGSIQVVKGSDAVRYGSDALGGVIVMEQSALPFRGKALKGQATALYGSNGHRYVATTGLEGAFPFLPDVAWRLQGTYSNAGDRSTAHYLLNNTGTREHHFSASVGYDRGPLRIEGLYSRFYHQIGIMLSAQMGSEDLLAERIRLGRPVHTDPFSRSIIHPSQQVTHQTAIGKVKYNTKRIGSFLWQGSWQKDDRQENRVRRLNSDIPAVSLHLSSFQNLFCWEINHHSWRTEAGGQMLFIDNHSRAGTGIVPVIPNYTETQMGVYAIEKYYHDKGSLEGGIRFDRQETRAGGYDWTGNLYGGTRAFNNLTYSLGSHYHLSEHWKITSNFGLAWRAPHVYELYSNGNELGSGMFVKGDSTMRSERSYKWITSVAYQNKMLAIRVDGYLQWIDGYIYDEPIKETVTVISGVYPVFSYKQTSAFFRGMDFDVRFKPSPSWDYRMVTSFIRANERRTGNYFPYIPSFRLAQQLAWMHETKSHLLFRLNARHRFVAKQTRFDPNADLIPYTPSAYHLFGFDAGVEWTVKHGHKFRVLIAADNLLNKEYKEYTNRSRYYAHDMGRDIRCSLNWTF